MIVIMIVAVIQMFILAIIYASRYKKVPPDKAMIVYGGKGPRGKEYLIISGGGRFIQPFINAYAIMPLDARSANLNLKRVPVDNKGEKNSADLDLVVVYKISSEEKLLRKAAETLLHKSDEELNKIAEDVVTGTTYTTLRNFKAPMLRDEPDEAANMLKKSANLELNKIGMELSTLKLKTVKLAKA